MGEGGAQGTNDKIPPKSDDVIYEQPILLQRIVTCLLGGIMRYILINLCFAPKDHDLFVQWYHEMNNGSMRLLRTGATQGNPYSYSVRVGDFERQFIPQFLLPARKAQRCWIL